MCVQIKLYLSNSVYQSTSYIIYHVPSARTFIQWMDGWYWQYCVFFISSHTVSVIFQFICKLIKFINGRKGWERCEMRELVTLKIHYVEHYGQNYLYYKIISLHNILCCVTAILISFCFWIELFQPCSDCSHKVDTHNIKCL